VASDLHSNPQDLGFHRAAWETLVSLVGSELNSKLASGGDRIHRRRSDDKIRIYRIYRLHVAIDGQPADQAIGSDRFTSCDHACEIGRASLGYQFVRLHRGHTLSDQAYGGRAIGHRQIAPAQQRNPQSAQVLRRNEVGLAMPLRFAGQSLSIADHEAAGQSAGSERHRIRQRCGLHARVLNLVREVGDEPVMISR